MLLLIDLALSFLRESACIAECCRIVVAEMPWPCAIVGIWPRSQRCRCVLVSGSRGWNDVLQQHWNRDGAALRSYRSWKKRVGKVADALQTGGRDVMTGERSR